MKKTLKNQNGSIILEMLLGIALFIIVLPMLMTAVQERNKRLEEQAIASQIDLIRESANNYLSANKDKEEDDGSGPVIPENITIYQGVSSVADENSLRVLKGYGIKEENLSGIIDGNSLGQTYHLVIKKEVDASAGTMFAKGYILVTKGDLTKLRLKRIANSIGFSAAVVKTERNSVGDPCESSIDDYVLQECIASTSGDLFQVPNDIYGDINTVPYIPATDKSFILVALTDGDVVVSEFLYKDKTSSDSNIENTLLVDMDFSTSEGANKNLYDVYNANTKSINISSVGNPYGTMPSRFENVSVGTFISNGDIGSSTSPVQYIENQDEGDLTIDVENLSLGHIITKDLNFNTGLVNEIQVDKEVTVNNDLSLSSTVPMLIENLTLAIDGASPSLSDLGNSTNPVQNIGGYFGNVEEVLIKLSGSTTNDININNSLELGGNQVGIIIQDTSSFTFATSADEQLTVEEVARLNPGGETSMVKDINLSDNTGNYYTITNILYDTECISTSNCPASAIFKAFYDVQKAMQIAHFCFEKDRLVDSVFEGNCPLSRTDIEIIRSLIPPLQAATLVGNVIGIANTTRALKEGIIAIDANYWQ